MPLQCLDELKDISHHGFLVYTNATDLDLDNLFPRWGYRPNPQLDVPSTGFYFEKDDSLIRYRVVKPLKHQGSRIKIFKFELGGKIIDAPVEFLGGNVTPEENLVTRIDFRSGNAPVYYITQNLLDSGFKVGVPDLNGSSKMSVFEKRDEKYVIKETINLPNFFQ